ncbi:hypothetical protein MSG28_001102 [Choristoneura fumiferana]|uniref:Uncharacterized protein n=1 Tax=Choristoneura fumiferana TaxID=7141 RepID=A0ACC0K4C7_CHOFU|nr:hypothetical protein MSG28_001102 [Choristoneura fumiferana]
MITALLFASLVLFMTGYILQAVTKPKKYPPGPRWLPMVGSSNAVQKLTKFYGSQWKALSHLAKEYSSEVLGLKLGSDLVVVVYGDRNIRQVFIDTEFEGRPDSFFIKLRCFGKRMGESIAKDRLTLLLDLLSARSKAFSMAGGWLNQFPWCRFIFPEASGYTLIRRINKQLADIIEEAIENHKNKATNNDFIYSYLEHMKDNKDTFTGKELRLVYTSAFLLEVQRYYTIVPLAGPRRVLSDTVIGGYSIPKETTILLAVGDLNFDPNLYDDPHEFKPERFINEQGALKNAEHVYTFGLGRPPLDSIYSLGSTIIRTDEVDKLLLNH